MKFLHLPNIKLLNLYFKKVIAGMANNSEQRIKNEMKRVNDVRKQLDNILVSIDFQGGAYEF